MSDTLFAGEVVTDPKVLSAYCARHFFPAIKPDSSASDSIRIAVENALFAPPEPGSDGAPVITSGELSMAISSLNQASAPGLDGVSISLFTQLGETVLPTLLAIYNSALRLACLPSQWKLARVKVIRKPGKGSYETLGSFRPISVVNSLAESFEKVLGRLTWLSTSGDWLSPCQHGFIGGRSTETAGHALVSFIERSILARE